MSRYFHSKTYSISCDSNDLQMSIRIWVDIILETFYCQDSDLSGSKNDGGR